jgi:hypothetical protein
MVSGRADLGTRRPAGSYADRKATVRSELILKLFLPNGGWYQSRETWNVMDYGAARRMADHSALGQ